MHSRYLANGLTIPQKQQQTGRFVTQPSLQPKERDELEKQG